MNVPPHLFSLLLGPLLFSTSATDGAGLAPRLLAQDPKPGAAGIGDPYFPLAGNGGYDVQHYDLTLEVDMENGDILGKAMVVAVATQDLSSFHLDLHGLEVLRVDVNGKEAEQAREGDELIITPASPLREGDHFSTIIDYYGVPEPVRDASIPIMSGVGWAQRDSGVCVFSECTGAPSWFPCNDHPRDKATYSISVTVAKPWIVAANGVLAEEIDNGKQRTYRWQCNSPMATYLATVNIAKFGMKLEEGPGGIPMRLYYPADSTEAELAEFAHTREIIEHFSELFGPYPFESVGGLISYEPIGGALETQTMPVYGRGMNESVVAHELAHQWFGDCVSVEEWKDLWLNEGFATYADWLWTEHTDGAAGMEREVRRTYRMLRRGRFGPPPDPGLGQLFGPRVYQRGAMVLHALRGEVGDEVFFRILRTWVEEHHNGNASTADFTAHAARIAGRSLDSVFQPWLFDPVIPEVPELEPQSQQQEQ